MGDSILQTLASAGGLAIPLHNQELNASPKDLENGRVYIKERDKRSRTANRYGMSMEELWIASAGIHEMIKRGRRMVWAVSSITGQSDRQTRENIRSIRSMAVTYQRRLGLPHAEWIEILEGTPAFHSNLILAAPDRQGQRDLGRRLNASKAYEIWAQPVQSPHRLIRYLAKEVVPQVAFAARESGYPIRRLKNAARGSSVSGDRVRISANLQQSLIGNGQIKPRKKTYVTRAPGRTVESSIPLPAPSDLKTENVIPFPFEFWRRPIGQFTAEMMAV